MIGLLPDLKIGTDYSQSKRYSFGGGDQQTSHGADISIRCAGEVDVSSLRSKIASGLKELGLENPDLSIAQVDRFERLETGKLKRFIPLASL
jgi:hypothetical protein